MIGIIGMTIRQISDCLGRQLLRGRENDATEKERARFDISLTKGGHSDPL